MKLLKDSPYLSKSQWRKLFLAMSIMVVALYLIAMVFSLCGSKYFILNYQNEQMDKIEAFLQEHYLMALVNCAFTTIEFFIIISFVLKKLPKWYYIVAFYCLYLVPYYIFKHLPIIFYKGYPFIYYLGVPLIELAVSKELTFKNYGLCLLKLLISVVVTYILQVIIYVIKSGNFAFGTVVNPLAPAFVYAIEYDIALSVILITLVLLFDKEKGDSTVWTTSHNVGGFSQTSRTKSRKSNLTKTQKNKLRLLYLKFYLSQLGAFLLLMVLPFLLGKVFEFLVMYTAFAIARYLLGFKYSLHYKKEALCITVGAVVFGIFSLAVPFFYVVVIMAILLGVALAVLLHLSYKYKGFYLFNFVAKPDKFAELYVLLDGDLTPHHVKIICNHRGLDKEETEIMLLFAEGNKKSYIAKKLNYSEKTIERKINEAIDKLNNI